MPCLNDILTEKKSAERKEQYAVQMIHYEKLIPNRENRYSTENIKELANMIRISGGIKQPVLARKKAPEEYELVAGHRRRLAVKYLVEKLGLSQYAHIPVHLEKTNDIMSRINMYITNAGQRDKTDYDRMIEVTGLTEALQTLQTGSEEERKLFCELCEAADTQLVGGRELRQIVADKLGLSVTKTAQLKHIENKLEPELKEKFKMQEIGISAANKAAGLPPEKQKELARKETISIQEADKGVSDSDTQVPGQTELIKDFPEYVPEEMKKCWGAWNEAESRPVTIEGHAKPPQPESTRRGHVVKISSREYDCMVRGDKLFKLIKNNQDFKENDDIEFWKYENGMHTGKKMEARINFLEEDANGLTEGYCIIGFQIMNYDIEDCSVPSGG